jgi:levanase
VTYNNVPDGRRIMIGWMNNWNYAGDIPTSPWRSAMTVPRQLSLRSVNGSLRLFQWPVSELTELQSRPVLGVRNFRIRPGATRLPANGKALELDATLAPGSARRYGLEVRVGDGQRTVIGYDRPAGRLYINRSHSGDVTFDPSFSLLQQAPLSAPDGVVRLHILVDWSSVEVFAQGGRVLMTDQIFPKPSSSGLAAFATGGSAKLVSLTVRRMHSAWRS